MEDITTLWLNYNNACAQVEKFELALREARKNVQSCELGLERWQRARSSFAADIAKSDDPIVVELRELLKSGELN